MGDIQTLVLAGTGVFIIAGILAFLQHHLQLFSGKPPIPNNVFVRWLTEGQKEKLRLASIPYTQLNAGPGEDGVSFSPQSFARAKRLLKGKVIEVFPPSTGRAFEEAVLAFPNPNARELRSFDTKVAGSLRWYDLRGLIKRRKLASVVSNALMPSVKKDIVIHLSHGQAAAPVNDGKFHVFLHSTPANVGAVNVPSRLLGATMQNRATAFSASGNGVPIIEPNSNFAVAELVDTNLYVHLDLVTKRTLNVRSGVLLRVLQQVEGELAADQFLAEIIESVKAEDAVSGNTASSNFVVENEGVTGRRAVVLSSLVKEILAPVVGSNVVIRNCAGQNANPVEDGKFRIFLYSSPIGAPCMVAPERVWGHRMLKREPAFAPSANGMPIIDDNGFIVGEIIGRNLYLHMQFIHFGAKMEAALAAKLLVEVRKEVTSAVGADRQAITEKVGEHFVDECLRQFSEGKGRKVTSAEVSQAQANFSSQLRAARLDEFNLFRLQAAPGEEIGREFDELMNLANVKNVRVEGDLIVVTTDKIYCVHPKTNVKYDIGAFDIHISTADNMIKWFNKTRKVTGGNGAMNAPHVDGNGNACMGNTKDLFPNLISRREYSSAIQLAIAFVEAVNVDDAWGAHIGRWPEAN